MCKTLSGSAAKILHPWPHLCAPQTWLDLGRFACPQRADGNSQQGKQRCSQRCFFFFFSFRRAEIGVVKRRWLSYLLQSSTVREISVDHSRTLRLWYDVWALKSSLEEIWEEKWGVMQVLAQPKPWLWLITASSRLSGHTSWKLQMLDSSSCSDNNNNNDDDEHVVCFGLLFFQIT